MRNSNLLSLITVVSVLAGCSGQKWNGKDGQLASTRSSAAGVSEKNPNNESSKSLFSQKALFQPFNDYNKMNDQVKERLDAVGILIGNETLVTDGGTGWKLGDVETLKTLENMCDGEYMADEIAMPGSCSAFLIAPDIAVTSGHCMVPDDKITSSDYGCSQQKLVFGFKKSDSEVPVKFSEGQVYNCKELLAHETDGGHGTLGADYSIFRLDRPVSGITPLKMATSFKNKVGDLAMLYAYPLGASVKTSNGRIAAVLPKHFVLPASTYPGSSGAPVIDNKVGEVIGIVARGEKSLIKDEARGCYVTNHCEEIIYSSDSKCRGETAYGSAQDQNFQSALTKVLQQ